MTIIGTPFPFPPIFCNHETAEGSEWGVCVPQVLCGAVLGLQGVRWRVQQLFRGAFKILHTQTFCLARPMGHRLMGIAATPPQQRWLGLLQGCSAVGLCSRIWGWCQSCPRQWGEMTRDHLSPAPPWTELGQDSGQKECSWCPGEALNHTWVLFVFPQDAWCWPTVTWHILGKHPQTCSNLVQYLRPSPGKPLRPPGPAEQEATPAPAVKPSKPLPTLLLHLAGVPIYTFFYPLP